MDCTKSFGMSFEYMVSHLSSNNEIYYIRWHNVCNITLYSREYETLYIIPKDRYVEKEIGDIEFFTQKFNEIDDVIFKLNPVNNNWIKV